MIVCSFLLHVKILKCLIRLSIQPEEPEHPAQNSSEMEIGIFTVPTVRMRASTLYNCSNRRGLNEE